MDSFFKILISLTTVIVTMWIVERYLNIFFKKRNINFLIILLWSAFGIFQFFIEYYDVGASPWVFLLNIIFVAVISFFAFEKAGNKKLFYVALLFLFWMLIEIFCYYLLEIFPINKEEFGLLGSAVSKLIAIAIIEILHLKFDFGNKESIPNLYYCILLSVPFGSAYIAHNIFILDNDIHKVISMISFSILLAMNLMIFEINRKLAISFIIKRENIMYEQQMILLAQNTQEQKIAMKNYYEDKHNLINQLIVLKENIENDKKKEVLKELNQLIKTHTSNIDRISNSGNSIVDALINFKYSLVKGQGIDFDLKIFIPADLPIQPCDLGILLGNSLDNAIEATKSCENENKVIHISIGLKKSALVLVISNPYSHTLQKDKFGNLQTTKKESLNHGYGISSIKKVAKKYKGEVIIDTTDGIFTLTIIINI